MTKSSETKTARKDLAGAIKWNAAGLVAAIAQDAETGRVLMMAWMNEEALEQTVAGTEAVYWSRSRQALWRKGEQSGNTQQVVELRLDCDGDCILLKVKQKGGVACHTGRESCFYRQWQDDEDWKSVDPVRKSPALMYGAEASDLKARDD